MRGTIDIVAGREKERLTALSDMSDPATISSNGFVNAILGVRQFGAKLLEFFELDKVDEPQGRPENTLEGDDSPRNVFARTYLSMNASPDVSFDFNVQEFENFSGPSHVTYSHLCRTYAEDGVRLHKYPIDEEGIPGSVIDMDRDGNITLQSGTGATAAKIILKTNGNIILKPGLTGVVYLGADENDTTGSPAVAQANPDAGTGIVVGIPPGDTFGGVGFLNTPVTGYLSDKVRLKIPGA